MTTDNVPDRTVTVSREDLSTVLGAVTGMLDTFRKHEIETDDIRGLQEARDALLVCMSPIRGRIL